MSLRARLVLGMGAVAVVLLLAGVGIARTTERNLVAQVDDQLRDVGPQLRGLPRPGDDDRPVPGSSGDGTGSAAATDTGGATDGAVPPPTRPRLSRVWVGRVADDGQLTTVVAADLSGATPVLSDADLAALERGRPRTVDADGADFRYRVAARADGPAGTLLVALPLDDVDEAVRRLVAVELLAGAALLAVLGLVTWWVVHLGVRPVRRMTEAATAIAGGDLTRRVPTSAPGTEAGDLGVALNQMLERIEVAFDERTETEARLRRFIGDASHELRTPVATIRGYAELYRVGALSEPTALDDALRRTEEEAVRMGGLIDDLLHLARLDQGRPLATDPVDLAQLAADAALDAGALAPEREVTVTAPDPVLVRGDDARLRQVVTNLVANALVHAPGAAVRLEVGTDGDGAVLVVADDGPGMAAADADRAFERFYRADTSRDRHRGGSGLGLAIVEATVRSHGGRVELTTAPGQGTTVRVHLPRLDAGAAPP